MGTTADRAKQAARSGGRWIASQPPITMLVAGWIVFVLGSYPGYMSVDSAMQLFAVRSGQYSDAYSPVMTFVWSAFEWVAAGPFPMLALQSGLFLFGLAALLRTVLKPRAAAVTACAVLLFPPVFAPMAVIWPESLMAGLLLAGTGALLEQRRAWKIAGIVMLAIACSCRPEIVFAIIPIVLFAVPAGAWWRRAGIALAITIGIASVARLADYALTDTQTYAWRQNLMGIDLVGTLRRGNVKAEPALVAAVEGLPIADRAAFRERITAGHDALDWFPLAHGERRVFDPLTTDEQADALGAAWRRAIGGHLGAYLTHRFYVSRNLLGLAGSADPIYDSFGDPDLMSPLHHRATASDFECGMRAIVRAVGKTPLFKPWLYFLLAIAALVLTWRRRVFRALVVSGLVLEVTMLVLAPGPDYRFSHWLVTATSVALAAVLVSRKQAWRPTP